MPTWARRLLWALRRCWSQLGTGSQLGAEQGPQIAVTPVTTFIAIGTPISAHQYIINTEPLELIRDRLLQRNNRHVEN